ncbi:non-ribosomal peptide synthetase [Pseudoalteromonas luteoviolacea]|uniref:Carrier domain-containing protein n=1 Tax=Pseudoalteromonas luteoviolacea S4060-1 TaxID=1365257 RepID=A0A162BT35_9GAMM|nr:non-ribosomal peptide synthetase [Pseudoalteromonas luteoviolacea]KZN67971.1 hypothetical protein N478_17250 [Pseudoalteromonas luteoviolacea S4060-1]
MELLQLLDLARKNGVKLTTNGQQLTINALKQPPAELVAEIKKHKDELIEFLNSQSAQKETLKLVARADDQPARASSAQRSMWFLEQMGAGKGSLNFPAAFRIEGLLNVAALEDALNKLVVRHEILSTTLTLVDNELYQHVNNDRQLTLAQVDLSNLSESQQQSALLQRMDADLTEPFNISEGEFFRASLLKHSEDSYVLIVCMHHIVSDGWSVAIMLKELQALYGEQTTGIAANLPELSLQYADFSDWQSKYLSSEQYEQDKAYWLTNLENAPALHSVPLDNPRPSVTDYKAGEYAFDCKLSNEILNLAKTNKASVFMVLHAAYALTLSHWSNTSDIILGTPIAGRPSEQLQNNIGCFINMLVLRSRFEHVSSFADVIAQSKNSLMSAYEHQNMPFEALVEELNPDRSVAHSPIFQLSISMHNYEKVDLALSGTSVTELPFSMNKSRYDVELHIFESSTGELSFKFIYANALFSDCTIKRLAASYISVLNSVVNAQALPLGKVNYVCAEQQGLVDHHENYVPMRNDECLHSLFEDMARTKPDALALRYNGDAISYRELNEKSNKVARYLQSQNIEPETPIAICLDRSFELIIAILGVLKAGGCYVAIDPSYPEDRIEFILDDADIKNVITTLEYFQSIEALSDKTVLPLDEEYQDALLGHLSGDNLNLALEPQNLAYIVYTSGSTGNPKGVLIEHNNVTRVVKENGYLEFDGTHTVAQWSSASFDAVTMEIWGALLNGGCLALYHHRDFELQKLNQFIVDNQVTTAWFTSGLFTQWSQHLPQTTTLKYILTGGDVVNPQAVANVYEQFDDVVVFNGYGPTENTTFTYCYPIDRAFDKSRALPLKGLLRGTKAHILTESAQLAAIGAIGELCVSGQGVARGYLGLQSLTQSKFIANTISPESGNVLYKTGDLVRYRPDGSLDFIGRVDTQVKIRGFRVELGEIENVLLSLNGVLNAAVTVFGERKQLVAYICADVKDERALKLRLAEEVETLLPDYMRPHHYVLLSSLALNASGKVDKSKLPEFDVTEIEADDYVAPESDLEKILVRVWRDVLGNEKLGITDNFFNVGGDSIVAIAIIAKCKEQGLEFGVQKLFESKTIKELAAWLEGDEHGSETNATTHQAYSHYSAFSLLSDEQQSAIKSSTLWDDIEDAYPLTQLQQGMLFHSQSQTEEAMYHDLCSYRLKLDWQREAFEKALTHVVQQHPILRSCLLIDSTGALQVVKKREVISFDVVDLSELNEAQQLAEIESWKQQDQASPFEEQAPLWRIVIHVLGNGQLYYHFSFHHAILDGWSVASFNTQLFSVYDEVLSGSKQLSVVEAVPFAHYVRTELQALQCEQAAAYWQSYLQGARLPWWSSIQTPNPQAFEYSLSCEQANALTGLAKQLGVQEKSVYLSVHMLLLYVLSGDNNIATSVVANCRPEQANSEKTLGLFLNSLPFVLPFDAQPKHQFVKEINDLLVTQYAYRNTPLAQVQSISGLDFSSSLFNFVDFHVYQALSSQVEVLSTEGVEKTNYLFSTTCSKNPLTGSVQLNFSVAEQILALLPSAQIKRTVDAIIASMIAGGDEHALSALCLEDDAAIIKHSPVALEQRPLVHEIVASNATENASKVAIRDGVNKLTYSELDNRASALAKLMQIEGIVQGDRVGVCMERSCDLVVAILALFKLGAVYVPLDPTYPLERTSMMIEEASVSLIITESLVAPMLDEALCPLLKIDSEQTTAKLKSGQTDVELITTVTPQSLAYIIFTSGSTGKPKGVMISHLNLQNFFMGLDEYFIAEGNTPVWLASTSINFDISILELVWTVYKGYEVVIQPSQKQAVKQSKAVDFGLFYFAAEEETDKKDKYRLLLEGAKFADKHDFSSVWVPERHFASMGALYPNPSVSAAAVASVTNNVTIRSGSLVLPLHDPLRVAEEWSMVDNLSKGRAELSIASGWHPNDFVLQPKNYTDRHRIMRDNIDVVKSLWRGESISRRNGEGESIDVSIYPKPVQSELPIWITAAGSDETFRYAGSIGANLLTHLLGQNIDELTRKINIYREALASAGFSRDHGKVALMLHTFVGECGHKVKAIVEQPLKAYLKHSLNLLAPLAKQANLDIDNPELINLAFERYYNTDGLFGDVTTCSTKLFAIQEAGVDEIACLIDFGIDHDVVLEHLPYISKLKDKAQKFAAQQCVFEARLKNDLSTEALIEKYDVTHIQMTPSVLSAWADSESGQNALSKLRTVMVGGEALPTHVAQLLLNAVGGNVYNMYGPTETTIWSAISQVTSTDIEIGLPITNTQFVVVGKHGIPVPKGVPGELYIGGASLASGYWGRKDLSDEKFVTATFGQPTEQVFYKTGDLVRMNESGMLEFLGRNDEQIKIKGHRVELGEIESVLKQHKEVTDVVVLANKEKSKLCAFITSDTGALSKEGMQMYLQPLLPSYMLPSDLVILDSLPLMPNGKVNRSWLTTQIDSLDTESVFSAPETEVECILCEIWSTLLNVEKVSIHDKFYDIGGHSLLITRLGAEVNKQFEINLPIRVVFENQSVYALAKAIENEVSIKNMLDDTSSSEEEEQWLI